MAKVLSSSSDNPKVLEPWERKRKEVNEPKVVTGLRENFANQPLTYPKVVAKLSRSATALGTKIGKKVLKYKDGVKKDKLPVWEEEK